MKQKINSVYIEKPLSLNANHVKKPTRSISGITPLTVVLKPRKCEHGTCIFCPGGDYVPQSYTDKSPAIMRALAWAFDPYKQVQARLKTLKAMNHPTEKIELIVLGGTFLQYDLEYQYYFIKRCFDALNGKDADNLKQAKKINEIAEHRCVAMCTENRPDNCSGKEIKRMREFGATRVELGVQILDDDIYKKINRGHSVQDVIEATKKLKDAGFKVGYHIMPGLPGSNIEKDITLFKQVFNDDRYRPDQLKLYPCQIVADSPLAKIHKLIKYKPYDEKQTRYVLSEMIKIIPRYCRVMRVMREFPQEYTIQGVKRLDLRKDLEKQFRDENIRLDEIRYREIGFVLKHGEKVSSDLNLNILEYNASKGKEFFLEIVNKNDILFGLLRLRFPDKKGIILKELKNCALIRELHVYGQALNIGEKSEKDSQHQGFGKWLMEKSEGIAKKAGYKKIAVISGVGVREYYKKLGYKLEGEYMVKEL